MLESNSNGDGVEVEGVEVEGMEVVWIWSWSCVQRLCYVSWCCQAMDLGSDTMKDLKLARVHNNGGNKDK